MGAVIEKVQKIRILVDQLWSAAPAVPRWRRMCQCIAEYLLVAMQSGDPHPEESEVFRKAIGYLGLPPKRTAKSALTDGKTWAAILYYGAQEQRDMSESFGEFLMRLTEWVQMQEGDEDEIYVGTDKLPFVRNVWLLLKRTTSGDVFKTCCGQMIFRPRFFKRLGELMPKRPIEPDENLESLGEMGAPAMDADAEFRRGVIRNLREINANTAIPAREILSDGQSAKRVGTDGEIAQENEVIRRVQTNDGRGISGFVAAVLRDPNWQLRGGHSNTEKGWRRCYSRVYELLHPARRKTKRKV